MKKFNLLVNDPANDLHVNEFDSMIIADYINYILKDDSFVEAVKNINIDVESIKLFRLPSSRVKDGVLLLCSYNHIGNINGIFHVAQLYDSDQVSRSCISAGLFSERISSSVIDQHVLLPFYVGRVFERSYSFSKFMHPLSSGKIWFVQKRYLSDHVLTWLVSFSSLPIMYADCDSVYKNLDFFNGKKGFIGLLNQYVVGAKESLKNGSWQPVNLPDHNDLWKGNILVDSTFSSNFQVIDWAAANVNGYGVHDLVTFSLSFGVSARKLNRYLKVYKNRLGMSSDMIIYQYLSSLGFLGRNMNNFPYVRYLQKINIELSFLIKALVN